MTYIAWCKTIFFSLKIHFLVFNINWWSFTTFLLGLADVFEAVSSVAIVGTGVTVIEVEAVESFPIEVEAFSIEVVSITAALVLTSGVSTLALASVLASFLPVTGLSSELVSLSWSGK